MMRTRWRAVATVLLGLTGLGVIAFAAPRGPVDGLIPASAAVIQDGQFSLDPDTLVGWDRGPAQPVFFSHRRHAGVYEIECLYCHANTDRSPAAGAPSVSLCLGCHRVVKAQSSEIQKLRGYMERSEPIPWERIYRVADFVQFNHARHVRAEVECQECHGDVEEYDVLWQWSPLTMGWCLGCHKERPDDEAQIAEARAIAERYGREGAESKGLYPLSIDSDYGVLKGPIDCAACHY